MSQLVVIAYPDEATVRQAIGTLERLSTEQLINLEDAEMYPSCSHTMPTCPGRLYVRRRRQVAGRPPLTLLQA